MPGGAVASARKREPMTRVYRLVVDRFAAEPAEVSFHSSNAWDVAGPRACGFQVVWVNRTRQLDEYGLRGTCPEVSSLANLPDLVGTPPSA
jgi:2-haloacid dehalogenase